MIVGSPGFVIPALSGACTFFDHALTGFRALSACKDKPKESLSDKWTIDAPDGRLL
jgi:hypothetical protein